MLPREIDSISESREQNSTDTLNIDRLIRNFGFKTGNDIYTLLTI